MTLSTLDAVAALVVIDLQRGVASQDTTPHAFNDVVARSAELADAFRERRLPVVLVRVTIDGAGFSHGRVDRPHGMSGSLPAGFDEIVDDLAGHPDDAVVTKRSVGAFVGTELDLQLRRRGVTQVLLTGVATSMGVEGTARAAHDHGYHVVVVTDAVADTDATAHDHSVEAILPRVAETATTAAVLSALPR